MRKSKMVLLAAALAVAVSAPAVSADRAGIGLNWAIGPMVQLGPFDMEFGNGFTLGWKVTERFTVGVFREDAMVRGEHTYTTNNVTPNIDHTMVAEGNTLAQGLSFLTNLLDLPIVGSLAVGLEVGTQEVNITRYTFSDSDGGATSDGTDFGLAAVPVVPINIVAPIMGVAAKLRVLEFETKTVTTCIDVNANLRFVPINENSILGTQETDVTLAAGETMTKIDPVSNFNTLSLTAGVGIWF